MTPFRLITTFLLLFAATVTAQEADIYEVEAPVTVDGHYISGTLGATFFQDSDGHGPGVASSTGTETGYFASIAYGFRWNDFWSAEIELARRAADVDNGSVNGFAFNVSGHQRIWAFMINGIYHPDMRWGCFEPYFGFGFGLAHHIFRVNGTGTTDIDDTQNGLAIQSISGVSYPITDCVDLCFEYRYFFATDPRFRNRAGTGVQHDAASQSFAGTVRWYF